jgi:hypothetical protein
LPRHTGCRASAVSAPVAAGVGRRHAHVPPRPAPLRSKTRRGRVSCPSSARLRFGNDNTWEGYRTVRPLHLCVHVLLLGGDPMFVIFRRPAGRPYDGNGPTTGAVRSGQVRSLPLHLAGPFVLPPPPSKKIQRLADGRAPGDALQEGTDDGSVCSLPLHGAAKRERRGRGLRFGGGRADRGTLRSRGSDDGRRPPLPLQRGRRRRQFRQ